MLRSKGKKKPLTNHTLDSWYLQPLLFIQECAANPEIPQTKSIDNGELMYYTNGVFVIEHPFARAILHTIIIKSEYDVFDNFHAEKTCVRFTIKDHVFSTQTLKSLH